MIRDYQASDEPQWLATRLLAFFGTNYYDDVKRTKTAFASPSIQLVDAIGTEIVGLIDVEIHGDTATIDTIAIRPDHRRTGIGRGLLTEAIRRLPSSVKQLDAWTREDQESNDWYQAMDFIERYRYLHVYRSDEAGDPRDGFETPTGLSAPIIAMMHAPIELESEMRARYERVYVCRQYVLDLAASG